MTERENLELELRRVLGQLRHMYWNMVNGHVRAAREDIKQIADGILGPQIKKLEKLADSLMEKP